MPIDLICLDADDTLWHNMRFFAAAEDAFVAMLAPFAEAGIARDRLAAVEVRNLPLYGYGAKSFTLSMIETAIEITDDRVPASVIRQILEAGREMLEHPVETLPHAHETLERLTGRYRLLLVTKGDLFDQERKLAASGLGDFFDAVEIVSDKNQATYERVFARHGDGAGRAMMVGNSLKSDVVPAIEAGGWGVFVPHELTWVLEHVEPPRDDPRFREISHLGELEQVIAAAEEA